MKSDYMESQKFCTCIEIRKNFKNCVVLCAFQCFVFFLSCNTQSMMGGWLNHYSFRCQPVDYTDNPKAIRVSDAQASSTTLRGLDSEQR